MMESWHTPHRSPPCAAEPSFVAVFCRNDTRLMLLFMGLFNLKSSFYIATFASQMKGMFYAPTADALATTFAASAVAPVAPTASFAPASFACAAAFRFASSARACLPR